MEDRLRALTARLTPTIFVSLTRSANLTTPNATDWTTPFDMVTSVTGMVMRVSADDPASSIDIPVSGVWLVTGGAVWASGRYNLSLRVNGTTVTGDVGGMAVRTLMLRAGDDVSHVTHQTSGGNLDLTSVHLDLCLLHTGQPGQQIFAATA